MISVARISFVFAVISLVLSVSILFDRQSGELNVNSIRINREYTYRWGNRPLSGCRMKVKNIITSLVGEDVDPFVCGWIKCENLTSETYDCWNLKVFNGPR